MDVNWPFLVAGLIALALFFYLTRPRKIPIDPRTGRPNGDHGTALEAIEFAIALADEGGPGDCEDFLRRWREGDLGEYPEFYEVLAANERRNYAE